MARSRFILKALAATTVSTMLLCCVGDEAASIMPPVVGGDAGSSADVPSTDGGDSPADDASVTLDAVVVDAPPDAPVAIKCPSDCPHKGGPCAVRLAPGSSTCIDSTEVTVAQFRVFSEATKGTTIDVGAPCPLVTMQALGARPSEALPMTEVTFCEARAFCNWAGKSLCGQVGGGPIDGGEPHMQTSTSYNACTGGSGSVYQSLSDGGCRFNASGPRVANGGCEGSIPGVFDLVGNVWEWVDLTATYDAMPPAASWVGGSYVQTNIDCTYRSGSAIDGRRPDVGFRCCSP